MGFDLVDVYTIGRATIGLFNFLQVIALDMVVRGVVGTFYLVKGGKAVGGNVSVAMGNGGSYGSSALLITLVTIYNQSAPL